MISGLRPDPTLQYQCHICHGSSEEQHGLKRHLRENYGYQVLCSYCGEFECTPGESDLFREHLKDKHREVARSDAHISKPSLTPFQIDSLVNWHSSLRAPDVVPPSPTSESTELHSPLATTWDYDNEDEDWIDPYGSDPYSSIRKNPPH